MSDRRALLDPDMYKISEEDSQDEEVLSGTSVQVANIEISASNGTFHHEDVETPASIHHRFPLAASTSSLFSMYNSNKFKLLDGHFTKGRSANKSNAPSFFKNSHISQTNITTSALPESRENVEWPNSSSNSSDSEEDSSQTYSSEDDTNINRRTITTHRNQKHKHHRRMNSANNNTTSHSAEFVRHAGHLGDAESDEGALTTSDSEESCSTCSPCATPIEWNDRRVPRSRHHVRRVGNKMQTTNANMNQHVELHDSSSHTSSSGSDYSSSTSADNRRTNPRSNSSCESLSGQETMESGSDQPEDYDEESDSDFTYTLENTM